MNEQVKTVMVRGKAYTYEELAWEIASHSNSGEWYGLENDSTHISEWLAQLDFTGGETIESLAEEWDD